MCSQIFPFLVADIFQGKRVLIQTDNLCTTSINKRSTSLRDCASKSLWFGVWLQVSMSFPGLFISIYIHEHHNWKPKQGLFLLTTSNQFSPNIFREFLRGGVPLQVDLFTLYKMMNEPQFCCLEGSDLASGDCSKSLFIYFIVRILWDTWKKRGQGRL